MSSTNKKKALQQNSRSDLNDNITYKFLNFDPNTIRFKVK